MAKSAFQYYFVCLLTRAFHDTKTFFGWNRKTFIPVIMYLLGLYVHYNLRGTAAVVESTLDTISFFLIPGAIALVLVIGWNLLMAPFRLMKQSEQEFISWKKETETDFLRRNPQYKKYETITNLARKFAEGRHYDQQGGFPPDIGPQWNREVELLLSDLDPQYLWTFQQHSTLDGKLREIESVLGNI